MTDNTTTIKLQIEESWKNLRQMQTNSDNVRDQYLQYLALIYVDQYIRRVFISVQHVHYQELV